MLDDHSKWNRKYKEKLKDNASPKPNERLITLSSYFTGGTCLDIACGLGANSMHLAKLGYFVQAIDISEVAIDFLKQMALNKNLPIKTDVINLNSANLTELSKNPYDLIVNTFFLNRDLFPSIKQSLKEHGLFFMETFYSVPNHDPNSAIKPEYKLKPNELYKTFSDWEILYFKEEPQAGYQTLLARKSSQH